MSSSTSMKKAVLAFATLVSIPAVVLALNADLKQKLDAAKYVYIASTRKSGQLGKPAEIWFMEHDGAVYVGTPPVSYRVKRIKAGRTKAKIWVGKANGPNMRSGSEKDLADLPSFTATGSIVKDPKVEEILLDTYAKKYPEGWSQFSEKFKSGFKDGTRVLVKYTPD
jgi:hypothetical protein